jgi:hypothetical protein
MKHLDEALRCARSTTGEGYTFHWPVTFVLESLMEVGLTGQPGEGHRWAQALLDHTTTIGMRRHAERARAVLTSGGRA